MIRNHMSFLVDTNTSAVYGKLEIQKKGAKSA